MILYTSLTAFCLLLFFYLLLFLCPNRLLSLNTEGHKLSSSISALRFAISELSSLSYSFFFHPLYLHLLSVSFLKWLLSQCDLELPYWFFPLAAVYISHRLCIFDLKEFPASSAFDFLSSSILLTSVTSLVACPLEMKNLWAVSAVTKNSSLCQLSDMLRPTFFSANNFFFQQEHQSVQKSFTNAIVFATAPSLSTYFAPLCTMLDIRVFQLQI